MARSKSRSASRSGESRRAGVSLPSMCIGLLGKEVKSNWMGLNRASQLEASELGGALMWPALPVPVAA